MTIRFGPSLPEVINYNLCDNIHVLENFGGSKHTEQSLVSYSSLNLYNRFTYLHSFNTDCFYILVLLHAFSL